MLRSNECGIVTNVQARMPKGRMLQSNECGIATNVQARMPKGRMLQSNECGIATNVFDCLSIIQFQLRSRNYVIGITQ